ncbi:cyclin-I-like [Homarus americanus]|uniref:Cyclin-I-like n=1 Tax=Homarus americanus TaxID=6706 RepID=A0A8J5K565_HOMAM|nr:cyclin-I-like [Homarus americanus]
MLQGGEVDVGARNGEVQWLREACGRLGWASETRFIAAALLDRLLHRVRIPPRYLHAVAAAAVFLAAKIHEEDENVPATIEVVELGGMKCSHRELLRMERVLLDKLSWHLQSTSALDFLQVLHALAIVTAPKHQQSNRSGSPTRQLSYLTERLWRVVCSSRSGSVRPSLLSLALLSIELDASTPEPGLMLWLQALTQVGDDELASARELVQELLGEEPYQMPQVPHNTSPKNTQHVPPSRPNKRKVAQSLEPEDDVYVDIKKLYAYEKIRNTTVTPVKDPSYSQEELDETYIDIRHLYSSPAPVHDDSLPSTQVSSSKTPNTKKNNSSKKKKKKMKPTFKAKASVRSSLKQALKIPCKISLIATKKIFEEPCEEDEEEEDIDMEYEDNSQDWEGPLVEPVGLLKSPVFSPTSPEFPDIRHLVVKKEDMCWHQQAQEVAEQVYRPLTYAQVLRLHLTPFTRALGV